MVSAIVVATPFFIPNVCRGYRRTMLFANVCRYSRKYIAELPGIVHGPTAAVPMQCLWVPANPAVTGGCPRLSATKLTGDANTLARGRCGYDFADLARNVRLERGKSAMRSSARKPARSATGEYTIPELLKRVALFVQIASSRRTRLTDGAGRFRRSASRSTNARKIPICNPNVCYLVNFDSRRPYLILHRDPIAGPTAKAENALRPRRCSSARKAGSIKFSYISLTEQRLVGVSSTGLIRGKRTHAETPVVTAPPQDPNSILWTSSSIAASASIQQVKFRTGKELPWVHLPANGPGPWATGRHRRIPNRPVQNEMRKLEIPE